MVTVSTFLTNVSVLPPNVVGSVLDVVKFCEANESELDNPDVPTGGNEPVLLISILTFVVVISIELLLESKTILFEDKLLLPALQPPIVPADALIIPLRLALLAVKSPKLFTENVPSPILIEPP